MKKSFTILILSLAVGCFAHANEKDEMPRMTDDGPDCMTGALIMTVQCQDEGTPQRLLTIPEAHRIFCSDKKITDEEKSALHTKMSSLESCVQKTLSTVKNSKDYEARRSRNELKLIQGTMAPNLKKCIKALEAGQLGNGEKKALLKWNPDSGLVQMIPPSKYHRKISTHPDFIGAMFMIKSYSLCAMELQGF